MVELSKHYDLIIKHPDFVKESGCGPWAFLHLPTAESSPYGLYPLALIIVGMLGWQNQDWKVFLKYNGANSK